MHTNKNRIIKKQLYNNKFLNKHHTKNSWISTAVLAYVNTASQ